MVGILKWIGIGTGILVLSALAGYGLEAFLNRPDTDVTKVYIDNQPRSVDERLYIDCHSQHAITIRIIDNRQDADMVAYQVTDPTAANVIGCVER